LKTQVKTLKTEPATWKVLVDPKSDLPEQKVLTRSLASTAFSPVSHEGELVTLFMPPNARFWRFQTAKATRQLTDGSPQ
jgi:hypothetical protein